MKRQTEKTLFTIYGIKNIFQVFLEFAVFLRDSFEYLSFVEFDRLSRCQALDYVRPEVSAVLLISRLP